MASSYSDNLKIELITDGEQAGSWGSTTNTNWEMIEAAVSAKQIVNITTDKTSNSPQDIALADGDKTNTGGRAFIELTDNGDKALPNTLDLHLKAQKELYMLKTA